MHPRIDRAPPVVLQAFALGLAILAVYAAGACRTIYVGDSGELLTAIHVLGIPHPTGYPLYVLLGKLWALAVPVGELAWRMSLFSAACGAAASAIAYGTCRDIGLGALAALLAATLLAFAPSFWAEATVQSVYTLNALFVVAATGAAWHWWRTRRPRTLALAFFLCGLGAANHSFMLVYAAMLGPWAIFAEPALVRRPGRSLACAAAFLAGLLPYAYLPLRSRANPPLDWGNPETIGGFVDVVFRRHFWQRAWIEGPADLLPVVADQLRSVEIELTWPGALLAVIGALGWLAASERRSTGTLVLLPLLIIAGNLAAMAAHGSRADLFVWHRYYVPSYAMATFLAGLGCDLVLRRLSPGLRLLPLVVPLVLLVRGWQANDRSRYRVGEDFAQAVLESLPPKATLIADPDHVLFLLMYLHLVENVRPDVNLVLQKGIGGVDPVPLAFNPDTDAVHFTHQQGWAIPGLQLVPIGLTFRAWAATRPWPQPIFPRRQLDGEADARVPKDYLTRTLLGHFHYMLGVSFEERDWRRARDELRAAAAAAPDDDALFFNLAMVYARNGLLDDAIGALRRSEEINPRFVMSRELPLAGQRLAELEAERQRLARIEAEISAMADPALEPAAAGTAAWHRRMAALLGERGELIAARGHRRRAVELERED